MTTWILILTLAHYQGVAIHSVPGFNSQAACMSAGSAYLKRDMVTARGYTATALCVEQPAPPEKPPIFGPGMKPRKPPPA